MTYERGTRKKFVVARQVLSPQGVEGVSHSSSGHRQMLSPQGVEGAFPYSSFKQVQVGQKHKGKGKGKGKMHEKDHSDGHEGDFDLVNHEETQGVDVIDLDAQDPRTVIDMIIKEQEAEIQALSVNLERAKWVIKYLEQENKQLIDKQVLMELQMIKENQQKAKKAKVKLTSIEQEIENDRENWLERVSINLEKLLENANRDKKMFHHMAYHYMTWNKICNIRMRKLKERLRKALKSKKEKDKLKILAEASLDHQRN